MAQPKNPTELFAVNLAALAREISMDLFPLEVILGLHKLDDRQWARICSLPHFQQMLASMIQEWESAMNTRERVKAKAQTGLEMNLESLVLAMGDENIPLSQRVEAGKFLARLGELDGQASAGGPGFAITLNIGSTTREIEVRPKLIDQDA
jgi:hypothetical protein